MKHAEITEEIIGVFYAVYSELGHGFLESVYQKSMHIALMEAGLGVQCEIAVPVVLLQTISSWPRFEKSVIYLSLIRG